MYLIYAGDGDGDGDGIHDLGLASRFVVGALAGATSVAFTYPFDLLRARLAVQTHTGRRFDTYDHLEGMEWGWRWGWGWHPTS